MRRFLIFPLISAIVGALFPVFCMAQGMIPMLPIKFAFAANNGIGIENFLGDIFAETWKPGAIASAVFGGVLALWDLVRNRRDLTAANRLAVNLAWCLFYAVLFIGANGVLVAAIALSYAQQKTAPPQMFTYWPFLSAALINFTAILWAAIRSIQTDDVLTPRVLREKLRRSSRAIT